MEDESQETQEHEDAEAPETEASEDTGAVRPILWLLKLLEAGKKSSKDFWRVGREAWNEYLCAERKMETASELPYRRPKKYRIFWASVRSIQPAFYSRQPETVAKRMWDSEDDVGRVACVLAENISKVLLQSAEFDATMCALRDDFILADRATGRVYFEADVRQEPSEMGGIDEVLKGLKVCTLPINFDDIVHTPYAKHWDEITELGWRVTMTKDAFTKRFGATMASAISWSARLNEKPDSDTPLAEENTGFSTESNEPMAEVWEIWCKTTRKVYWVSEQYKDGPLDVKDDPYELVGFFPVAPFIIGTKPDKSLYPTPMYVPLRPLIEQMHNLINKIFELIPAVRRRAIADGSCEDLIAAINNAWDNEVIAVQNFSEIVEKGGIANLIQYLPIQELSNAIIELQGLTAVFKQEFYEFSGVPDLLRGSSDPIETAAAQQQKGQFTSLRFSWPQKQIQRIARDLIEMMLDLALKKFPDDYLYQISGAQFLPQQDQQLIGPALQLLRDDKSRTIRIDIETDSTSYLREVENQKNRTIVAQTVMNGLKEISSMSQTAPEFVPVTLRILLSSLRSINMGKDFEGDVVSAVQQLEQQSQQATQTPPPPDYEQMKLQIQQQKIQSDAQQENFKLQLQQQKDQADISIKQMQLQLESRMVQLSEYIQQQTLELNKYKAQLGFQEQFLEERRLAADTELRMQEQQQGKPPKGPDTVIINAPTGNAQPAPDLQPVAIPVQATIPDPMLGVY